MEKTIVPNSSPPPISEYLRRALALVSKSPPTRLRLFGPAEEKTNASPQTTGLHGGGLHAHNELEVCYAVQGACRVWSGNGFVGIREGELLIIPPGLPHAEGWIAADRSYRLLWLALTEDTAEAFTDTYAPRAGWMLSGRVHARGVGSELLRGTLQANNEAFASETDGYLLKGVLLVVLARLREVALKAESGQPAGAGMRNLAEAVQRHLDLHFGDPLTVAAVAARFRRSPNYLNRIFSECYGIGIHAYLLRRRLEAAHRLLTQHDLLVKEAAALVGFSDPLHFSRQYKQRFGISPSETRQPVIH